MHAQALNPIPKAIGIRVLYLALLNLLSVSRWAFDSSGSIVLEGASQLTDSSQGHSLEKYLRWDDLYFVQIGLNGYEREQDMAFFPLWPLLMRWTGMLVMKLRTITESSPVLCVQDVLLGGVILANLSSLLAIVAFYKLTSLVIRDSKFAYIATILYALHPAPGISAVPYTEPFYALCTLGGSWLFFRQQEHPSEHRSVSTMRRRGMMAHLNVLKRLRLDRVLGVSCLMLATGVRSLGVLNCALIGWPSLVQVYRDKEWRSRSLGSLVMNVGEGVMVVLPFALFQYRAWESLCADELHRPWCARKIPLAYSFIQEHYWDVGFLRYWKIAQLPNFALASPVLALSIYGIYKYGYHLFYNPTRAAHARQRKSGRIDTVFWGHDKILPFFLVHTFTTWLLLFASHTQIALRLSMANPVIYWIAAALVSSSKVNEAKWGRGWLRWSAIWGCISIVLWSGFYPPA